MDTAAGEISFSNEAVFENTKEGYLLLWKDALIFPELTASEKVSVTTQKAARGKNPRPERKDAGGTGNGGVGGRSFRESCGRRKILGSLKRIAQLLEMDEETVTGQACRFLGSGGQLRTPGDNTGGPGYAGPPGRAVGRNAAGAGEAGTASGDSGSDAHRRGGPFLSALGEAAAHLIGYVQTCDGRGSGGA